MAKSDDVVCEITIHFHTGTPRKFYGVIRELKFEGTKITQLQWENAKCGKGSSLTQSRLRFVDITRIRDIVETAIPEEDVELDGKTISVTTGTS